MKRQTLVSAQPQPAEKSISAPTLKRNRFTYPLLLVGSTLLIFVLSQVIAFFIVGTAKSFISHGSIHDLSDSILAQFFYILIAESMAIWLMLLVIKKQGLSLSAIGLGRKPNSSDIGRAALGFLIFLVISTGLGILLNQLSPEIVDKKQNIGFDNITTGSQQALAFLALVILPPVGEEILVRGYLYSGLRRVWNFVPALLITSLLFGLAHLELGSATGLVWAAAIDTLVLSVILVYLREKTGALYASMLVHMLNNLLAFFVIIK